MHARSSVNDLAIKMALEVVDNLRPVLERENLMPTRLKIQDQFLESMLWRMPPATKN